MEACFQVKIVFTSTGKTGKSGVLVKTDCLAKRIFFACGMILSDGFKTLYINFPMSGGAFFEDCSDRNGTDSKFCLN